MANMAVAIITRPAPIAKCLLGRLCVINEDMAALTGKFINLGMDDSADRDAHKLLLDLLQSLCSHYLLL